MTADLLWAVNHIGLLASSAVYGSYVSYVFTVYDATALLHP